MSSKLKGYIESLRHDRIKNIKLPFITPLNAKTDKKLTKSKHVLNSNSNRASQNQSKLSYSKPKPSQQAILALKSQMKRITTQHTSHDLNKLSKLQQNIMMQIKNIDVCLQSQRIQRKQKNKQNTSLFGGSIFKNQIDDFLVEKFHQCLALQSQASYSITDGFEVQKYLTDSSGQVTVVDGKIVNNVPSISNKLLTKSITAIQNYDEQKSHEFIKNYGKQWSLHKRDIPQLNLNQQQQLQKQLIHKNYSIKSNNGSFINYNISNTKLNIIQQTPPSIKKSNDSRSTNLFQSKISALTKNSKISLLGNLQIFNTKNKKSNKNAYTVKTQPNQISPDKKSSVVVKLTKKEVRFMLEKCKNLVSIWIPPSSYPQFFGIFSYKIIKSQTSNQSSFPNPIYKCKLTKYFFNKFGLNKKIFESILEYLCYENNFLIESLEITVQKSAFNRTFNKMGWVMKSWDSASKIKASFYRQDKQQK